MLQKSIGIGGVGIIEFGEKSASAVFVVEIFDEMNTTGEATALNEVSPVTLKNSIAVLK